MGKKKSLIMWADKNIFKTSLMKIKEGIGGIGWTYTKTRMYNSPFNSAWSGEPHTDNNCEDVIKVRITIEELT